MDKSIKFYMCEKIARLESKSLQPQRCIEILKSQYKGSLDIMLTPKIEELVNELMKLSYANWFTSDVAYAVRKYFGG